MSEEKTICNLDYLIGTLATAYKGLITSLVLKDFCMVEKDGSTIFKGTVLSMPEGTYMASLIHEGFELSRGIIQNGFIELYAENEMIGSAKNLQIDILQSGRHIGTFLLKKEKKEGFFISALELSEETKGINFGLLTGRLRSKVGLLKKAEDIISEILSTKQDWKKFSEKMNSFSKDLFWFDREAYYAWYEIMVKWSVNTCERIDCMVWDKAISNVLSLIELPLEKETDMQMLVFLVNTWLNRVKDSSISLAAGLTHARKVFSRINEVFPDTDIGPALRVLINSLHDRIKNTPALNADVLRVVKDIVSADDQILLSDYSEEMKKVLEDILYGTDVSPGNKEYAKIFEVIDSADMWLSKDRDMITVFSDVIERNISKASAEALSMAFMNLFPDFNALPSDLYRRASADTINLMKKLIDLKSADICETLLTHLEKQSDPFKTDIILNPEAASAILDAGDNKLISRYKGILAQILIPAPGITGFSRETWAEIVNPLHLTRIAKFMDIIKLGAGPFKEILIRTICNLYVSGVFIPDDRLFQREISKYLNSGIIRENYLLHYMLLKKLPVYYHEVGATGRLRDDSTEIDSWGNDPVLYFLRKQVHVNASNHLIPVIEDIIKSWVYKTTEGLKLSVPEDILKTFNTDLLEHYSPAIRPLFESFGIINNNGMHFEKLLSTPEDDINRRLLSLNVSDEIRLKILLLCRIYCEIARKYSLVPLDIGKEDIASRITMSIQKLKHLKDTVLSPQKTQPEEALFFKRHIAFGIPSVMGSYHEPKFDAFGETLRTEEEIRTLHDAISNDIKNKESGLTLQDVKQWICCVGDLNELLQLHDLGNFQVDEAVEILRSNELHISQIVDLLRICQRELTWLVEIFNMTFQKPLLEILEKFPKDELPEYLRGINPEDGSFIIKAADIIIRALMNSIPGFFELDRLFNNLIDKLTAHMRLQPDEIFRLTDNPRIAGDYFSIDNLSDEDAMRLSPSIGNKAKNLVYLNNKGLFVPCAVVLPAERTRNYEEYTESDEFKSILRNAVREIEDRTGAEFGGKQRPLLLSVRSGSYISMPGILSSILYCGMNKETLKAFIDDTENSRLAWDSYRRFIEHYGTVVYDLDMDIFETIVNTFMKGQGVTKREDLNSEQMAKIVHLYSAELSARDRELPDDVYEQLKESVKAVFRSWYSERSVQFRKAMGISEHWGTSVTLMQMIYGNDPGSGASVFFTRKPLTFEKGIYGDTKEKASGGELVYGRTATRPLTRQQALINQQSLEEIDPQLFGMHEGLAGDIEKAMRGLPQEVEATYVKRADGERIIYVLQTKRMEFHRGFTKRFDDICRMEPNIIGRGAGVYGGALSGTVTFSVSPELIRKKRAITRLPVILLRKEASTNDVALMPEINGIITSTGGATSHAAILAQKFHLTAVIGCSEMKIGPDEKGGLSAQIGTLKVAEGDYISLDGSTGLVYSGLCSSTTQVEA